MKTEKFIPVLVGLALAETTGKIINLITFMKVTRLPAAPPCGALHLFIFKSFILDNL